MSRRCDRLGGPAGRESESGASLLPLVNVAAERDFQYCTEVLVRGRPCLRPTKCEPP